MSDYQCFKAAVDIDSNKIIHIDEVPEGHAGGFCPSCEKRLVQQIVTSPQGREKGLLTSGTNLNQLAVL